MFKDRCERYNDLLDVWIGPVEEALGRDVVDARLPMFMRKLRIDAMAVDSAVDEGSDEPEFGGLLSALMSQSPMLVGLMTKPETRVAPRLKPGGSSPVNCWCRT